ncbi:hypothetical protein D3C76_1825860 [compost metagenome]
MASLLYETIGQLNTPGRLATAVQNPDGSITRTVSVLQPANTTNVASYTDTGHYIRSRNIAYPGRIKLI